MPDDVHLRVDVSGMCCPLPLIELTKTVQRLVPGQVFEITGNDPLFESAVQNFCRTNGHTLIETTTSQQDQCLCMRIRVGNPHVG